MSIILSYFDKLIAIESGYTPLRFQKANKDRDRQTKRVATIISPAMYSAFDTIGSKFENEPNSDRLIEFYMAFIDTIFDLESSVSKDREILKKKMNLFIKQIGSELKDNKELRKEFGELIVKPLKVKIK